MKAKNPEVFKTLRAKIAVWFKLKAKVREATNEFNKQNTQVKNAFKEFLKMEDSPAGTTIELPEGRFSYTASESEIIDPKGWHEIFRKGEITEDQFYAALKVNKALAEASAGADQVANITTKSPGKKRDMRYEEMDFDIAREVISSPVSRHKGIMRREPAAVQPSASDTPRTGLRKVRIKHNG